MIHGINTQSIYLAAGSTDMRKSIDGLAIIVQESFSLDPFSPCLFAFCNRGRNRLKILQWDTNGFWLYYKRLEKGTFQWPSGSDSKTILLNDREFRWLLDGLSTHQKSSHPAVKERLII